MSIRAISEAQIESVVLKPDYTQGDKSDRTLTIAIRETSPGTLLKVWYRYIGKEAVIESCLIVTVRRERQETYTQRQKRRKRGKR